MCLLQTGAGYGNAELARAEMDSRRGESALSDGGNPLIKINKFLSALEEQRHAALADGTGIRAAPQKRRVGNVAGGP